MGVDAVRLNIGWVQTSCFNVYPFKVCSENAPKFPQIFQESPQQTKQRKGQNIKFMNFAYFCEFWCFSLRKTSTIHIELLFRNTPKKSSWTDLSLVWFAGATPECLWILHTLSPGNWRQLEYHQNPHQYSLVATSVHRIAAIAMATAIFTCQWWQHCVVNFGNLSCCPVREASVAKGKMTAMAKGDAHDVKHFGWRCWKTGVAITDMTPTETILRMDCGQNCEWRGWPLFERITVRPIKHRDFVASPFARIPTTVHKLGQNLKIS